MKQKLFPLFLAFLLLFCIPVRAQAAEQSREITISTRQSMAFTFAYDVSEPSVRFISPSGGEYGLEALDSGAMSKESGEGYVTYYIPQAEAGTWTVTYDKGRNQTLELTYAPCVLPPEILSFSITDISDGYAHVRYQVSHPNGSMNYRISAVVEENGIISGRRELKTGYAHSGSPVDLDVNLNKLSSYDAYQLEFEVWVLDGNLEASATALSGTFSYTAANTPEAPEGILVLADLTQNAVLVDWQDVWGMESYLLGAFYEGEQEPFFAGEYTQNDKAGEFFADFSRGTVRLEITARKNGVNTQRLTYSLTPAGSIQFENVGATNAAQALVTYSGIPDNANAYLLISSTAPTASVYLEEENGREAINLSGDGTFAVNLPTMESYISVYWQEGAVSYISGAAVYADRFPPMLQLFEHTTAISTEETQFLLAGLTESSAKIEILSNGKVIASPEPDASGNFQQKLSLLPGENLFDVTAIDQAGNKSSQVISIRCTSGLQSPAEAVDAASGGSLIDRLMPWRYGIFSLLLCLYGIFLVFLISGRYQKNLARFGKGGALWRAVRLFLTAACLVGICASGWIFYRYQAAEAVLTSKAFFELAQSSIEDAYAFQLSVQKWQNMLKTSLIATAIAAGAVLLLWLISSILAKQRPGKARPPKSAPPRRKKAAKAPRVTSSSPSAQAVPEPDPVCPVCGSVMAPGSKFCGICGSPMK